MFKKIKSEEFWIRAQERLEEFEEKIKITNISSLTTRHPILFSPLGSLTNIIMNHFYEWPGLEEIIKTGTIGVYPGYKILRTYEEYINNKRDITKTRGRRVNTVSNWILDNKHIVGIIAGTMGFLYGLEAIIEKNIPILDSINDRLVIGSLTSLITTSICGVNKYSQDLNFERERKGKTTSKLKDIATNPLLIATGISAYEFYKTYKLGEDNNFNLTINNDREMNKKFWIEISAIKSSLTFLAVEYITSLIKAGMQKETIQRIKLGFKQRIKSIQNKKDEVLSIQKEKIKGAISSKEKIELLSQLSRISRKYYKKTKEEKYKEIYQESAAEAARKIFNEEETISSYEYLKGRIGLNILSIRSPKLEDNLSEAIFYLAHQEWDIAERLLRKEMENNEEDFPTQYLYAKILQRKDTIKAKREFKRLIEIILNTKGVEREEDIESKNSIYTIKENILKKHIIIKDSYNEEHLQKEKATAEELKGTYKKLKLYNLDTYNPLIITNHNGKYYYLMEREQIPTFAEIIDENNYEKTRYHLKQIIEIVEFFHVLTNMINEKIDSGRPTNINCFYTNEERDLYDSIKKSLSVYTNEERYKKIIKNLMPVIASQHKIKKVVKKDPHPWNFLIDEEYYNPYDKIHCKYHIIDTEITEICPVTTEWAIMLFHKNFFGDEDYKTKVEILRDIIIPDNIENKLIENNPEKYLIGTYNSTISRTLELLPRLKGKKDKSQYRKTMLTNSLLSLEEMRNNHRQFYVSFKDEYQNLEECLQELNDELTPHSQEQH